MIQIGAKITGDKNEYLTSWRSCKKDKIITIEVIFLDFLLIHKDLSICQSL